MKHIIATLLLAGAASLDAVQAAPAPRSAAPDSIAERTTACLLCHGAQGRAASSGYFPRIAGKPQGYLYHQLLNFREGRRINPAMNHLVGHLSDAYLLEIAGHFAAQHPPYPLPQAATAPAQVLEQGRRLVHGGDKTRRLPACVACHGPNLAGVAPAIPGLLGLSRDYLNGQFGAWRNGVRRAHAPDCMAAVAARLTPSEIGAVAAWLSAQPVPERYAPTAAVHRTLPMPCGGMQ